MWFFPGFGIRPGRKVTWSKVLQALRTRGSTIFTSHVSLAMDPSLCLQMTSNFPLWVQLMLFPFPIITEPFMGTKLYTPIFLLIM